MTLMEYFAVPFEPGARGPQSYDCWGWVRALRTDVYGKKLLPEYPGMTSEDLQGMTEEYRKALTQTDDYEISTDTADLQAGSVVCVLRGGFCMHIGVVIQVGSDLNYADISPNGVRRMSIPDMVKAYSNRIYSLVYFNDHD